MIETGIGPFVRVLRHLTQRQLFYQLKFPSGERAVVLIAGMPAPSVEFVRLVLGGLVPWQTVWEFNPMRAGGYSDYIHKLKSMFSPATGAPDDALHYIRDALLRCRSINEARTLLLERERLASGGSTTDVGGFLKHEPISGTSPDDWQLGTLSSLRTPSAERARRSIIPNRYRIRNDAKGSFLTCVEAPTVAVRAERGVAVSAKQARNYSAGTIFLDGAAQGDPFVDVHKDVYNLDHHQGCIRSLATCEQAVVLIRKVLDLRRRDWVVVANDSDLDTILAVWVLFNHLRLNEDSELRARIMPLLRLEGIIDAHGLDLQDMAALTPDLLRSTSAMLKQLRRQEINVSRDGLLEYIADRLRAVDELIYSPEDFEGLHEVEELARGTILNGSVAVACRSEARMDEVERQLLRIYGQRLGILIIENPPSFYRVRQVDRTLPATLERAYERLNLLDPAVRGGSQNRWGGSAETGGSPRGTETRLMPTQIIEAVREAFGKPTIVDIVSELPGAVVLTVAALLPATALIFGGNLLEQIAGGTVLLSALVLTVTVGILFWFKARRIPGLYGLRAPTGFGWLVALPAAFIGAMAGGVWAPGSLGYRMAQGDAYEIPVSAAFLLPAGAELLFRGVILGHVASRLPIQNSGAPWWASWPTLISSALYAAASVLLFVSLTSGQSQMSPLFVVAAGALTFGMASGIARERSESIMSSVLLHWICAATLLLGGRFVF